MNANATSGWVSSGASGRQPAGIEEHVRITSIVGTLASVAIVVAFFLPWISVQPEQAQQYLARMEKRFDDPVHPVPEGVDKGDWLRLARIAADQGHVSGLDVFYWARTAKKTAQAYSRAENQGQDVPPPASARAIGLAAIVLAVLPVAALLLALYFVIQRLQRAHSPTLVLAVLSGAVAISVPAAYSILEQGLGVQTRSAIGLQVLGIAGAVLLLTGVFGVRLRNWWRVFLGAILVGGGLALVAWAWLQKGTAP